MSFDISLYFDVDTGGPIPYQIELYDRNVTYNLAPMFRLALGEDGIRGLKDRFARDAIPDLTRAVDRITAPENREAYEELNPSNGWGDHDGAIDVLVSLLNACTAHPLATIDVR